MSLDCDDASRNDQDKLKVFQTPKYKPKFCENFEIGNYLVFPNLGSLIWLGTAVMRERE